MPSHEEALYTPLMAKEKIETLNRPSHVETLLLSDPVPFKTLYAQEFEPTPYMVDQLLIKGGFNMLSGNSTVGKTWVTLEFALCVATGRPVFGHFPVVEKTNVLVINEEDTKRSTQSRLHLLTQEKDLPIYFHSHSGIRFDDAKVIDQVVEQVSRLSIGLVVLDNLTQLHGADENSAKEIQAVMRQIKRILLTGAAVLLVHHHRKDTTGGTKGSALRGSSSIFAGIDMHLVLEAIPDPGNLTIGLIVEKNKDDKALDGVSRIVLREEPGRYSFEYGGATTKSVSASMRLEDEIYNALASLPPGEAMDKEEISQKIGRKGRPVGDALKSLVKHVRINRATKGALGMPLAHRESPLALVYWVASPEEQRQNLFSPVYDDIPNEKHI